MEIRKAKSRLSYLDEIWHLLEFFIRDMMGRHGGIAIRHFGVHGR